MSTQALTRNSAARPLDLMAGRELCSLTDGVVPAPPMPRTAAGERAAARRRARVGATRRPPSGVLPSGGRTGAVVSADRGHELAPREFRMGRWARLVTTLCLVAAAVLGGLAMLQSNSSPAVTDVAVTDVTVAPGDSLWSIAEQVAPDADPRAEVDQIMKLNALSDDSIAVGLVLKVPSSQR